MSKTQIVTGGIADDAVSEEHLDATAITGSTELAATPADTDEILISDAGTLKRIDFSHIKSVNTPAFHVNLSSNQGLSHDTHTKIQFSQEVFDTASAYDSSTNYRFTVPSGQGGKYLFFAGLRFASSTANLTLKFVVGGSSNKAVSSMKASSGELESLHHMTALSLSEGDTVEVQGRHQSSGTLNVFGTSGEADSYFGGFKLAE